MKNRIRLTMALAAVCTVGSVAARAADEVPAETAEQRAERMAWFGEARFGMFIHWGLYAIPAGEWKGRGGFGEWIRTEAQIPREEYRTLLDQFNPVHFDADEWAKTAKDAGMRYLVITSKHHDGFALWNSTVSDYDVMATPFKRDILKELGEACRRHGIVYCFYHSIMDWDHPDYLPRRGWEQGRPTDGADFNRYIDYMKAQLKELITGYGPLGVLWFDGEWEPTWTTEHGKDLYRYVRGLQPSILVNNRVDKGRQGMAGMTRDGDYAGDFGTPEQEVPPQGFGPEVYWEACMTIGRKWCHTKNDTYQSSQGLIRHLSDVASKGGNFLLNVGPQADGRFSPVTLERLRDIAAWMKVNAEAIHGTQATPLRRVGHRTTMKPGRLFIHIHDWPSSGRLDLTGLMNPILSARLLARPDETLEVSGAPGTRMVALPSEAPDPNVSVVEIRFEGEFELDQAVRPDAEGVVTLTAADARIDGKTLRLEAGGNLGYWTNDAETASWEIRLPAGAVLEVTVEAACADGSAGGAYAVTLVDQSVAGEIPSTGGWQNYRTLTPGRLVVPEAGVYRIILRGRKAVDGEAVMNLKSIRLTPVE
jgi:alpha-L-fucosidase